jgi:hypothetical protein
MRDVLVRSWQAGNLVTTRHQISSLQPGVTRYSNTNHQKITHIANKFEDDAIVFTDWGSLYGFYYVSHLEAGRTDQKFHETRPAGTSGGFSETSMFYIENNIDLHPIYINERPPVLRDRYLFQPVWDGFFRLRKK